MGLKYFNTFDYPFLKFYLYADKIFITYKKGIILAKKLFIINKYWYRYWKKGLYYIKYKNNVVIYK